MKTNTSCQTTVADAAQGQQFEKTIRRSGAFLQAVIDAIPDGLLVIGHDYRVVLANRAAREMAGGIDPTAGLTCHQLSHHRDLPCTGKDEPCPLRQVIAAKSPVTVTHTHVDAAGKERFVEVTAAPVLDETDEVSYIIEACRDITERTRLERAPRLTQFSVDRAGDAVLWLGSDARFFYVNACACRHLGYSQNELLAMTVHDVDPNFPAEGWPKHWEQVKRRGSFTFESQHRTKDGGLVPVEITANYIEFDGKEYNCAFVRDITERKQAEEALQNAHDELEDKVRRRTAELTKANEEAQHLLGKLISAHEEERGRIARELHDEAGQNLTVLLLQLCSLERLLPDGTDEAKRLVKDLEVLAGSIVAEMRRMMKDLRPSLLDDMGLVPAVSALAEAQLKPSGVKFAIDVQGVNRKLASPLETALFRIFQEAITNIAKHARARNARIELRFNESAVAARIADDGRGFDPVASHTTWKTFGLLGIEERVTLLGGTLRIDSQAGRGTQIDFEVPAPRG
jgi:PAS domain S-box-containing protein